MRKANKNFKPEKARVSTPKKKRAGQFSRTQLVTVCLFAGVIGLVTLIWSRASELTSSDPNTVVLQYSMPMKHGAKIGNNLPPAHDPSFTLYGNGLLICGHGQEHQFDPNHGHTGEAIPKPATAKTLTKAEINELVNKVMDTGFMDLKPEYYKIPLASLQHVLRLSLTDQEKFVLYYGEVEPPAAYTATLKILGDYCAATTEVYVPEAAEVVAKKNADATGQEVKPIESVDPSVSNEINSSLEAAKAAEASVSAETKDPKQAAKLAIDQKTVKGQVAKELVKQLDKSTNEFIQKDGVTYETAIRQLPPEVKNPLQVDYNKIRGTKEQGYNKQRNPLANLLLPAAEASHDQERMPVRIVILKGNGERDSYPSTSLRAKAESIKAAVRNWYCAELDRCYVSYGVQVVEGSHSKSYYNSTCRFSSCQNITSKIMGNIYYDDVGTVLKHNVITLVIPAWDTEEDGPCGFGNVGYAGTNGLSIIRQTSIDHMCAAHELGHNFGLRHALFDLNYNLMDTRYFAEICRLRRREDNTCKFNSQQKFDLIGDRKLFRSLASASQDQDDPDPEYHPPPEPPPPPPPASQAFPAFSVDLTCQRIGIRGLHDPDSPGAAVGYQVRVDDGDGQVISYYDADGEDYGQGDFDLPLPAEDARNNGWRVTVIAFDPDPALNATRTAGPTGPCLSARCENLSVQSTRSGHPNGTQTAPYSPGYGQTAIMEPGKSFTVTATIRSGPGTVPPSVGGYNMVKFHIDPRGLQYSRTEPLGISLPPPTTPVEFTFTAPSEAGYYTGGVKVYYEGGASASLFTGCDFRIEVRPNKPPQFFPSAGFKPEATAPVTLNLEVNARDQDGDGSIAKVEFYKSGTSSGKLGEDVSVPYQHKWKITTPGAYTVSAYAYDHDGARSIQTLGTIDVLPPGRSSQGAALVWPGPSRKGITEIFVRENNSIYTSLNYPSKPEAWTPWSQKMDQVVSKPVVAYLQPDQLLLFGKRQDGFIYYRKRTGSGPTAVLGPLTVLDKSLTNLAGDPVVVTEPDGKRVHVFIRTTNKRIYTKSYDGKTWTAWQHLSSPQQLGITVANPTNAARSDPVVISRAPGQLEVITNTMEGQLGAQWLNIYSNNSWSGWYFIGGGPGGLPNNPVLTSAGSDHLGAISFSPSSKRLNYRNRVGSWGWTIPRADVGGTEILDDNFQYYNTVPTARFFKSTQHNTTYLNVLVKGPDGSLRLGAWGPGLPYENGLQTLGANPLPFGGGGGVGGVGGIGPINPIRGMGTPTLIGEAVPSHANVNTVQALVLKPGGWYVLSTSTSIDTIVNTGKANWSSPKLNQLGFPAAP